MECLRDRIGFKEGCGANTPHPLSINSLPGITVKSIRARASEKGHRHAVWDNIQTRAIYRFTTELRAKLAVKYKLNGAIQNIDLGQAVDLTAPLGAIC